MESRRQKKTASLILQAFSEVLQRTGSNYFKRAFVTITACRVTSDLLICRLYLSVYNVPTEDEKQKVIDALSRHVHELRRQLGEKLRHQLRRIPELEFFLDESLDDAIRMEEIFNEIKKKESER